MRGIMVFNNGFKFIFLFGFLILIVSNLNFISGTETAFIANTTYLKDNFHDILPSVIPEYYFSVDSPNPNKFYKTDSLFTHIYGRVYYSAGSKSNSHLQGELTTINGNSFYWDQEKNTIYLKNGIRLGQTIYSNPKASSSFWLLFSFENKLYIARAETNTLLDAFTIYDVTQYSSDKVREQFGLPLRHNIQNFCQSYTGDLTSKKCFDLTADFDVLDTNWEFNKPTIYYKGEAINNLPDNEKYICNKNSDLIYVDLINSKVCFEKTNKTTLSTTGTGNKITNAGAGSGSGNAGAGTQTITCNSEPNYNCVNGWKAGSYPAIKSVSGNGIFNCNGEYYKIESGNQYYCNPKQIGFWQGFFTKLKDAFKKKSSVIETTNTNKLNCPPNWLGNLTITSTDTTGNNVQKSLTSWNNFENTKISEITNYLSYFLKNKKINLDNELFTCINSKYKPTIIKYLNQSTIDLVELEKETLVVGADLFQQTSSNLNNPTGKYLFIGDSITVANWYKYSSLTGSARCAVGGGQATHILKYLESNCTLDSFIVCDNQKGCNAQKYNFTNFSDYETAVIHLGVNDLGITAVTPEILENRIQNIINFLNKQGIKKIILLTTIPTTTLTKNNEKMKASNAWIKGLNGINGITVVDASAAFYNNGVVNTNYFPANDGVHPNDAGKTAMSEALDKVITSK
jgi:hypothetical protein